MQHNEESFWKRCSICKKPIKYESKYYLCSVSTCRHKRKGYRFCSVPCWDGHLGFANHREAWAEEAQAPTQAEALAESEPVAPQQRPAVKKVINPAPTHAPVKSAAASSPAPAALETLVVVSKVKDYIRKLSDFNTSQCCIDALTRKVAEECRKAMQRAKEDGRKTVMGRDIL